MLNDILRDKIQRYIGHLDDLQTLFKNKSWNGTDMSQGKFFKVPGVRKRGTVPGAGKRNSGKIASKNGWV